MYAFSMTPASYSDKERTFENMELGIDYIGYVN